MKKDFNFKVTKLSSQTHKVLRIESYASFQPFILYSVSDYHIVPTCNPCSSLSVQLVWRFMRFYAKHNLYIKLLSLLLTDATTYL